MENRLRPVALIVCLMAVLVIGWATLAKTQDPIQTPAQIEEAQRQAPQVKEEAVETELHRAARAGDLDLLRSRLLQGMNPDERDKASRTPLMEAVKSGRIEA